MEYNVFDEMGQDTHPSHAAEFAKPVIAAAVGGYFGHKLDQTRFGIWYNHNPFINWVYRTGAELFLCTVLTAILQILWTLITS